MVPETSELWNLILNLTIWAALGAITRILFRVASAEEETPTVRKGIALTMASAGLGVMLGMMCMEVDHLKPWARVVSGAAGFLGHEMKTWIILLVAPFGKWLADKSAAWLKKRK